jgi:hypothetical protein
VRKTVNYSEAAYDAQINQAIRESNKDYKKSTRRSSPDPRGGGGGGGGGGTARSRRLGRGGGGGGSADDEGELMEVRVPSDGDHHLPRGFSRGRAVPAAAAGADWGALPLGLPMVLVAVPPRPAQLLFQRPLHPRPARRSWTGCCARVDTWTRP